MDACKWLLENLPSDSAANTFLAQDGQLQQTSVVDEKERREAQSLMNEYKQLFEKDTSVQDLLSRDRAVSKDIAMKFGVGWNSSSRAEYWAFQVVDEDNEFRAIKYHRQSGNGSKGFWKPGGQRTAQLLFPVYVQGDDPVWLCPGEFKALAIVGLGLPAIGVTSGEGSATLSEWAKRLLGNRSVALPQDNDEVGKKWTERMQTELSGIARDVRIVQFESQAPGYDVGDWIVEKVIQAGHSNRDVAEELLKLYEEQDTNPRGVESKVT